MVGIRFTSEISKTTIHFLYLTITLGEDGSVMTKVYRKATSTNSFLHWNSYHPTPLKSGIPIGQYLREKRNCSDMTSFHSECGELYNRFRARGYPKKVLHRAYKRARDTPREELLKDKGPICSDNIIRCIGTYDTNNKKVKNILRWGS